MKKKKRRVWQTAAVLIALGCSLLWPQHAWSCLAVELAFLFGLALGDSK